MRNRYPLTYLISVLTVTGCHWVFQVRPEECISSGARQGGGWVKNWLNPPRGHGEYRVVPFCLTLTPLQSVRPRSITSPGTRSIPVFLCILMISSLCDVSRPVWVFSRGLEKLRWRQRCFCPPWALSRGRGASRCTPPRSVLDWTGPGLSTALPQMVQSNYKSYGGLGWWYKHS